MFVVCIHTILFYNYNVSYNEKYTFMYKRNKHCHYTSSCIMINTLSRIT